MSIICRSKVAIENGRLGMPVDEQSHEGHVLQQRQSCEPRHDVGDEQAENRSTRLVTVTVLMRTRACVGQPS